MTNKEKFLALVSEPDPSTLEQVKWRIKNRAMLRESQKIALKVLSKLDELGWKQADLARKMGVSPQQITKIVSGKENLGLETQIKIQEILDVPILASYYETKINQTVEIVANTVIEKKTATSAPISPDSNVKSPVSQMAIVYNGFTNNEAA